MWRATLLLSLLLTLALAGVADAKCRVCLSSIRIDKTDSGAMLLVDVQAQGGATLPESATAVVMQVNGNRSKCLNVPVARIGMNGDTASYRGALPTFYGTGATVDSYSGRIDIAGDIFDFTVPTDGTPGTSQLITAAAAGAVSTTTTVSAATNVPTTAPTVVPATAPVATAAPETAPAFSLQSPLQQPMTWLALIAILATLGGAYADRKRAFARATAS
jgi:hypothetical protein